MLRIILGFRGTDTHGLKAFRRVALLDTVRACLVDKDVFASEFVIRADRGGTTSEHVIAYSLPNTAALLPSFNYPD